MRSILIALLLLTAGTVRAQHGGLSCERDLARAWRLVEAVAARDRSGPVSNPQRLCALLRQNRSDMAAAIAIMDRCMTGHARRENLGQMLASLEDVDAAIARRCR